MSVAAKISVVLEIPVYSAWGDNCTVAQVKKQALREANDTLNHALKDSDVKIKGELVCTQIIYQKGDD